MEKLPRLKKDQLKVISEYVRKQSEIDPDKIFASTAFMMSMTRRLSINKGLTKKQKAWAISLINAQDIIDTRLLKGLNTIRASGLVSDLEHTIHYLESTIVSNGKLTEKSLPAYQRLLREYKKALTGERWCLSKEQKDLCYALKTHWLDNISYYTHKGSFAFLDSLFTNLENKDYLTENQYNALAKRFWKQILMLDAIKALKGSLVRIKPFVSEKECALVLGHVVVDANCENMIDLCGRFSKGFALKILLDGKVCYFYPKLHDRKSFKLEDFNIEVVS